jgi:hypothetical protein
MTRRLKLNDFLPYYTDDNHLNNDNDKMPLKPFARPRQSMPAGASAASPGADLTSSPVTLSPSSPAKSSSARASRASISGAGSSGLPGTPTPLHGKSSLSRTVTTFEDDDVDEGESFTKNERVNTPLRKRLPRATIHGTPSYTNSAGTQTTPTSQHTPEPLQKPVNPHFGSLSTPTYLTRSGSRSRLSIANAPGSPYYSPDSPSQISRSTIIPFDVDASRRAAQEDVSRRQSMVTGNTAADDSDGVVSVRVQQGHGLPLTPARKEKGRLASLIGMVSTPLGKGNGTPVKRRGVVRKRSLWDR